MKIPISLIALSIVFCLTAESASAQQTLDWTQLPQLPPPPTTDYHSGLSGSFAGVHSDALIIAGGANFQNTDSDSDKIYHNEIYVLVKGPNQDNALFRWITGFKLDKPLAYGSSVSTDDGILCIGGRDTERTYSDVFLLRWNKEKQDIEQLSLPPLPQPCAHAGAAIVGNKVYVAAGTTGLGLGTTPKNFWSLDISNIHDEELTWQQVFPWPGPSRAFAIVTAQHNGTDDCIYIMSGRRKNKGGEIEFLTDVYEFTPARYDHKKYNPETSIYTGLADPWRRRADIPRCVMAAPAVPVGQSHIFILGGELKDKSSDIQNDVLSYHTITDTWTIAGPMPANHINTTALRWGTDTVTDPIVIPSGEINPTLTSPNIWQVTPVKSLSRFGIIDFSVIGFYLAAMIGVGVFFSFRNKNSDDYFRGGQRVPWLVAGLSIFATMLSSITFVAIPAKAYATDWTYFIVNMSAIAITPFVILLFLPFFRRIDATSAYEYLEKRFNRIARLFASASFVLFQVGRMAVVMYLPALALAAITPMTEQQCILLMGILSIIYCTMGGLEAVVWTDTIQSFVLLGGALFSLILIITSINGGLAAFLTTAAEHSKFQMINFDFTSTSFATTALWVVILGGIGQNLVPYTSDMAVVQRYMSVPDINRAKKAIWTNAVAILPASILFFGVGTALFVFYSHNPDRLDPTFKTDAIFPLFIARQLPTGIAGLVVAGIFAAAQSTISTSLNSTSTALVTDFVRPFKSALTERTYLRLGRFFTALMGILGILLALSFAASDIKSL
ncbi:MAG: sodium:solute symporter family protein [Planctomycetota bacterium]|jgi:SSS family transporter